MLCHDFAGNWPDLSSQSQRQRPNYRSTTNKERTKIVKANGERNLRSTDRLQCRVVIEKIEPSKWETLFLKPEPKKQLLLRAAKSGKVLAENVAELNRNE